MGIAPDPAAQATPSLLLQNGSTQAKCRSLQRAEQGSRTRGGESLAPGPCACSGGDTPSQRMGPPGTGCYMPAQRKCPVPRDLHAPAMAPLYIGFGSMKVNGTGLSAILAQALQQVPVLCVAPQRSPASGRPLTMAGADNVR